MTLLRSKSPILVTLLSVAALTYGPEASATTIIEDFTYTTGELQKNGSGSGWSGNWGVGGSTSRMLADNSANLSFTLGGYNIQQTGTGFAFGNFNDFRGINRTLATSLTGTIWFSLLINNTGADDHAGLQFNNPRVDNIDYNRGPFHVEVSGDDLQVRYNDEVNTELATLTLGETHLLLGKLTIGTGNDSLELWADPADLLNLGSPLFSQNDADMGDNLFLAGIFSYGSSNQTADIHGKLDALRISDGGGNPALALQNVTGIPEPSSAILLLTGGLILGNLRRASRSKAQAS